ncbi:MAG: hypothetical protein Q9191_008220, partial [Dirinaria sp. TL-2023a]
ATDDFREEDDEQEHEREAADFYALQRSRRQFVGSRLEESSEGEGSRDSGLSEDRDPRGIDERGRSHLGGINSSWRGEKRHPTSKRETKRTVDNVPADLLGRRSSDGSSRGKGHMEEIGLASTTHGSVDGDEPPDDLALEIPEDDAPSIQKFRNPPKAPFEPTSPFMPQPTSPSVVREQRHPPESDSSSAPPTMAPATEDLPRHDQFWASLYLICVAALFASYFLVYLHTYIPSSKRPLGDTVYTTVRASFHLLAIDTLVAVIVSFLWLAALRSYIRPLVYTMLIAVPVILLSRPLPWQ